MVIKRKTLLNKILREFLIVLAIWAIIFIYLVAYPHPFAAWIWVCIIPYSYFFFLINLYWLIPASEKKNKSVITYVLELLSAAIIFSFPFLAISASMDVESFTSSIFSFGIATIISLALAWLIYLHNKDQIQELIYLKKQLIKTNSNLQLLRSQINPHFLFNALNTFYGMAIRENAVKTSDGIQRLGDMMRFMLKDNQKDQIPLASEIGYLKDYIYIQQLRLAASENIQLIVNINEPSNKYLIAPMLLIPFVENAFKHGIRLQERSWVDVALYCNEEILNFEVRNSLHAKINSDTERASTGMGLENVTERLKLLYPNKYKLQISKNETAYIIRLTLDL